MFLLIFSQRGMETIKVKLMCTTNFMVHISVFSLKYAENVIK